MTAKELESELKNLPKPIIKGRGFVHLRGTVYVTNPLDKIAIPGEVFFRHSRKRIIEHRKKVIADILNDE